MMDKKRFWGHDRRSSDCISFFKYTTMLYPVILTAVFALVLFYLTSNTLSALRLAPAFPFVTIVFGLMFLYLFASTADDIGKYLSGLMFLVCGFVCMKDVEKLRRKGKVEAQEQSAADK